MSIENKDYLLRQIERLAELVASLVGGTEGVEIREVERECERVRATLLGPLREGFDRLTPDSALMMVGGTEKARQIARVFELEADLRDHQGNALAATTARRRSLALLGAIARRSQGVVDDAHRDRVAAITAKLPRS